MINSLFSAQIDCIAVTSSGGESPVIQVPTLVPYYKARSFHFTMEQDSR